MLPSADACTIVPSGSSAGLAYRWSRVPNAHCRRPVVASYPRTNPSKDPTITRLRAISGLATVAPSVTALQRCSPVRASTENVDGMSNRKKLLPKTTRSCTAS